MGENKSMKYKKCVRCELNYVTFDQVFCSVCIAEMSGKKDDFDLIGWDICPFCEKNLLKNGEEMCEFCLSKRQTKQPDDEI